MYYHRQRFFFSVFTLILWLGVFSIPTEAIAQGGNESPVITSTPITQGMVGEVYTYDVEATGTPNIAYSLVSAPDGMTIEAATGIVSWTPDAAGSVNVTVQAANRFPPAATQSFTIEVIEEVSGQAPAITSTPTLTVSVGNTYNYDVEATGDPAPTFSLDTAPSGMSIDPGSGLISWQPGTIGSFNVTVRAANGILPDATQSFTIEVTGVAPTITSSPVTSVALGDTYTYDVNATGNPSQSFSLTIAPEGMNVDAGSGVITWTPNTLGTFDVTVTATNGVPPDASQSFTITVTGQAPNITSQPVTNGSIGALYTYDVNATGDPAPTYALTSAPAGMTIDPTSGVISWTPTEAGNVNVTVVASNGNLPDATQSFTIVVAGNAPTITSTPVTTVALGNTYTYDVNATGDPAPTFSLSQAPQGMTIDSNSGFISWTPTEVGSTNVTVVASNGNSPDATQSFTIEVTGNAPTITSTPVTAVALGNTYTYDVNATGNPQPTYSLSNAPQGMSIDTNSGFISWTPSETGSANVTVVASNGNSPNATQSFTITVTGNAPTITSNPVTGVVLGNTYTYDVNATGNPEPTFSLNEAPQGMTINAASGVILWTPSETGSVDVTVVASNGNLPNASQSFTITVTGGAPVITSTPGTTVTLGNTYIYDVNATGNPEPTFSLDEAPKDMTIDPETGVISWEPKKIGSEDVTVVASNGILPDAIQSFTIVVTGDNITITSSPVTTVLLTNEYSYDVEATGTPEPTFSLSEGPEDMTIDPETGVISWIANISGGVAVTVVASNGVSIDATQSFTIQVTGKAPSITTTPVTEVALGDTYFYDVNATGNPQQTFSLTEAPDGMEVNTTSGVITWTPTEIGTADVTVVATNGVEPEATQSFTITVNGVAPKITSSPITTGIVDISYTYDVNATGTPTPTFALTIAPPGMTINPATGVISWKPSETGTFSVGVSASNGVSPDITQSYTLTVMPEGIPPVIISDPLTTAVVNEVFTYNVDATGEPAPRYSLNAAPSGMAIDPLSGSISWTPTIEGTFTVTVAANNGTSTIATQTFFLMVTSGFFAPIMTSSPVPMAVVNETYTYTVEATGNPAPTYALTSAPSGMTIDAVSGVISWTPTSEGSFFVRAVASNGQSPEAAQTFTLNVTSDSFEPTISSTPVTMAVVEGLYTYQVKSTGHPDPTYSLLDAPNGMSIDPLSGLISWAPAATGNYEVIVSASNGMGLDASQAYTLVVTNNEFAPVILSTPVVITATNESYAYNVNATGNPAPIYSLDAPPGIDIDPLSGEITWTPTEEGAFEVTVIASNGVVPDDVQPFTLIVTSDEFAPVITTSPERFITINKAFSYDVDANGNPSPTYSLEKAPGGMAIDAVSGLISWNPSTLGDFEVTVVATNGVVPNASESFTVSVIAPVNTTEEDPLITTFEVDQNYPNPFSSTTTIEYGLPSPDHILIDIYDVLGRRVAVLENSHRSEGKHQVVWDGRDQSGSEVPAGMYFAKVQKQSGQSRVVSILKLD